MLKHANLTTIKRHWLLVAALTVLGAVVAFGLSSLMTPLYRASAQLYFTLNFGNTASDLAQGSTYTSNQMTSFGELASSPVVLQPVIDRLGLPMTTDQLGRVVTISTPRDTVTMDVAVVSADPERSAEIANAIAAQVKTVVEMYAPQMKDGGSTVTVRTIKQATPPNFQFSPDKRTNTALGLAGGLLLGILSALAIATLDNRVRGEASLAEIGKVTFLGALRQRGAGGGHEATVLQEPTSSAAEEYRQLRSSLRYATLSKQPITLVITSGTPSEGKTTVALNLAAVIAESSQRVLLIDADLRRPRVASYSNLDASTGVTDVLVGEADLSEAIQPLGDSGVDVLTAGGIAPNPGELLASPQMQHILEYGKEHYDAVIIDTAPLLVVADALALTSITDGLVLVARADRTRKSDLQRSLETAEAAGAEVLGLVLNGAKARQVDRNRYYDYRPAVPGPEGSAPKADNALTTGR